jgi:hypothetical protein
MKRPYDPIVSLGWHDLTHVLQQQVVCTAKTRVSYIVCHQWNAWMKEIQWDWIDILWPRWHLTQEQRLLYLHPYSLQTEEAPSADFLRHLAFMIDNIQCCIHDPLLKGRAQFILENNLWALLDGLLAYRYFHPLDLHMTFVEEGHVYHVLFYDPVRAAYSYGSNKEAPDSLLLTSVTTFIGTLFEKFDGPAIIRRMMANKRKWNSPTENKYYGKSEEQILAEWDEKGSKGRKRGTVGHHTIEDCLNEREYDTELKSVQLFKKFMQERIHGKFIPYRTEQYLFNQKYRLVGASDALYLYRDVKKQRDADGLTHVIMVDWKLVEKYTTEAFVDRHGKKKMGIQPCTANLEHCKHSEYSIQQMLYSFLYRQYGIVIDEMWIVIVHPQQTNYDIRVVTWNDSLMSNILAHREETLLK